MEEKRIVEEEVSEVLDENIGKVYSVRTFLRQLPHKTDGLKPVNRRILLVLFLAKLFNSEKTTKSTSIVGRTIENYHPHGESSVYEAMVNMTDRFSIYMPYLRGIGNWGYITGDPAASSRYTECAASQFTYDVIFKDMYEDAIDWQESEMGKGYPKEPVALPTRLPLVLINGSKGIAEAFTSNIPSHNVKDIGERCIMFIRNKNITVQELARGLFPDYPNGGVITNGEELFEAYCTGQGGVTLKANIEIDNENSQIIIRDLPYDVTYDKVKKAVITARKEKNNIILNKIQKDYEEKSVTEYKGKQLKNSYWRYTCSKDANLLEIVNELYKTTPLKKKIPIFLRFNYNGSTKLLNLLDIIKNWYYDRVKVLTRIFISKKRVLEHEKHIYDGLKIFLDNMEAMVKFIKESPSKQYIVENLPIKFKQISQIQAKKISESPLYILTKLSKDELDNKIKNCDKEIAKINEKLDNIDNIIIEQTQELVQKYGGPRKTKVIMNEEVKTEERVISHGAVLVSANSYGIFDSNVLFNSKNILNGLKQMKLADGTVYRNIVEAKEITSTLQGIVLFYADGQARRIPLKDIPTFNTWIHISDDVPITHVAPYYSPTSGETLVIISKPNFTIKRVSVEQFSTRKANATDVVAVMNDNNGYHFAIDKHGRYWSFCCGMEMGDEDIPLLSPTSAGVKTPFSGELEDTDIVLVSANDPKKTKYILQYIHDDTGFAYVLPAPELHYHRNRKIKQLFDSSDLKGMEILSVSGIRDITDDNKVDKTSTILMIGKNNINKLNITNFKGNPGTIKKIMIYSLLMLQFKKD